MTVFAQHLRNKRKERGYTQRQMAELLLVDRSTYSKYEAGKVSPSFDTLCHIADALGCSLDWLFGRE